MRDGDKEQLNRRLAQARRMIAEPIAPLTRERLSALAADIEKQLAAAEIGSRDAPPE
jgi:hypothetical protein